MQFILHKTYSRKEINESLGGQLQHYLPFTNGKVVCGCFKAEPSYNPGAPEQVIFGEGKQVEESAELVYEQGKKGQAIPIFIFRKNAEWEYIGDYRCTKISCDSTTVRELKRLYPARKSIKGALTFQKA